jgi:hypothetical protein
MAQYPDDCTWSNCDWKKYTYISDEEDNDHYNTLLAAEKKGQVFLKKFAFMLSYVADFYTEASLNALVIFQVWYIGINLALSRTFQITEFRCCYLLSFQWDLLN